MLLRMLCMLLWWLQHATMLRGIPHAISSAAPHALLNLRLHYPLPCLTLMVSCVPTRAWGPRRQVVRDKESNTTLVSLKYHNANLNWEYKVLFPPIFSRGPNFVKAESWLKEIMKIREFKAWLKEIKAWWLCLARMLQDDCGPFVYLVPSKAMVREVLLVWNDTVGCRCMWRMTPSLFSFINPEGLQLQYFYRGDYRSVTEICLLKDFYFFIFY